MDLPFSFVRVAEQKLFKIISEKYHAKEKNTESKINYPDHLIIGYAMYCACFEKGLVYKDVRIANEL